MHLYREFRISVPNLRTLFYEPFWLKIPFSSYAALSIITSLGSFQYTCYVGLLGCNRKFYNTYFYLALKIEKRICYVSESTTKESYSLSFKSPVLCPISPQNREQREQ